MPASQKFFVRMSSQHRHQICFSNDGSFIKYCTHPAQPMQTVWKYQDRQSNGIIVLTPNIELGLIVDWRFQIASVNLIRALLEFERGKCYDFENFFKNHDNYVF
jgi:hypothetical protein